MDFKRKSVVTLGEKNMLSYHRVDNKDTCTLYLFNN